MLVLVLVPAHDLRHMGLGLSEQQLERFAQGTAQVRVAASTAASGGGGGGAGVGASAVPLQAEGLEAISAGLGAHMAALN